MTAINVGECWDVLVRCDIYGFAIENTLQFETFPGSKTAQQIAVEVHDTIMDQWVFQTPPEQTVRAVYVRRLDGPTQEYILTGSWPYKHGINNNAPVLPQLALCLKFGTGSRDRHDWSKRYWGALGGNFVDQGKVSQFGLTWANDLGVWLITNYGFPQLHGMTLIVWSRLKWAQTLDRNQSASRVNSIVCSERVAVVHSRRTGQGY